MSSTTVDIGIDHIVPLIIDSATNYLVTFMPLFTVIIGLLLAALVIGHLIEMVGRDKEHATSDEK